MDNNSTNSVPQIQIRKLYKIFGPRSQNMLSHVLNGMNKAELLATYNHVLGLQDINIDMYAGKITVVMGLSGSGKSTLLRHLNRLIDPTTGEILIAGEDVLKLSPTKLKDFRQTKMSMVFQKFALLPHWTVLKNTSLALQVRGIDNETQKAKARHWLSRVGLDGFENHYPHQLSGGMQQRVGIARALTSNSDIMLMDEAFSALDPLIRNDMQDLLLELQIELGKTIVFITHDLDEALKLADHLVILKDGAIVQQGEPQDILMHPHDPYIEDFISNINRARVLRVRSVMQPIDTIDAKPEGIKYTFDIAPTDTLESIIARSGGDTTHTFRVIEQDKIVGQLEMADLVKALVHVPSFANERANTLIKCYSAM